MNIPEVIDKKFAGIQLAFFEMIWPIYDWIEVIYVGSKPDGCFVHLHVNQLPDAKEQDACKRLLGDVLEVVLEGSGTPLTVSFSKSSTAPNGFKEALSDDIFKMIAQEVAPWRLDVGR
jgi:hypothetical protein